jgi:hypothetical protein
MSREKSSNRTAIPAKHPLEDAYRISFGEPTMFCVDQARLEEYLQFELERLSKSDKRA